MNLNLFSMFRDLADLKNEMNRVFGSFGSGWARSEVKAPVNVYESPEEYIVLMEAPGADKSKFDVSLKSGNLVVKGEIPSLMPEKADLHRSERACGEFVRSIELPGKVDGSKVEASFRNGLLEIRAVKAEEEKPKQVVVKVG